MSSPKDKLQREVLPIPDREPIGLTTYDAKDPETKYPPIRELRPPGGRSERTNRADRRLRLRRNERVRRAGQHSDRRKAGGHRAQVQPLPYHRAVLADPGGVALGPQPSLSWDGGHHGDGDLRAGTEFEETKHLRASCRNAQAEWLLNRAIRQVPRSPRLANQSPRSVRQLALRRWRLRVLLRIPRQMGSSTWRRPNSLPNVLTSLAGRNRTTTMRSAGPMR
jgi:hypothetical protein